VSIAALFRKKGSINLLPKDSFESSWLGQFLTWALVFGKWTVIITQLVVVGAFVMRFGLDRRLTDLRREIEKEAALIRSFASIEKDFRLVQKQLIFIKPVVARQDETLGIVSRIEQITPSDVWYERISLSPGMVTLSAYSASIGGFSQFLQTLKQDEAFSSISLGSLKSGTQQGAKLQFEVTLGYGKQGEERKKNE